MSVVENRSRSLLPKPFLKWAGGKRQLLHELVPRTTEHLGPGRYHEPFVGGGALFFELYGLGRLGRKHAYLSDTNPRLIETYGAVQHDVEAVIEHLRDHAANHSHDYYYEVRATVPDTFATRAARIIYLNRTCFNGLFRENKRGEFNVPIGRYANPRICNEENLRAVSAALQRATVACESFDVVVRRAKPGDFVYFDPPYHPLSGTANFTSYHEGDFTEDDQSALADVFDRLTENGVFAMLSNSDTPLIRELYDGYETATVHAARNVNSRSDRRGKISELIVTNF